MESGIIYRENTSKIKTMTIDPTLFELPKRVKLEQIDPQHIGIVKLIKSRIIQKDALKIIEVAEKIKQIKPSYKISLICNDNICSKSIVLLKQNNIDLKMKT